MIFDIEGVQKAIGYSFKDTMLLRRCFTHSSYANEHDEQDNEVLEFFGDAILEFVVTERLFNSTYGDEGKLTDIRKEIVNNESLLKAVKRLGLEKFVLMGKGQNKSVKSDEKLFSNIFEALIAGIYKDGGLDDAKRFIENNLLTPFFSKKDKRKEIKKDNKSLLQEYVQGKKMGSISYETLSKKGPDHLPEFKIAVLLNNSKIAEGKGGSKKDAEADGAGKALKKLQKDKKNLQ